MPQLVDGGNGVAVGVTGLHIGIVEAGADDGLHGRDALPFRFTLATIDGVPGQIAIGDWLPAQVNGW